jgi:hypothetical protein
VPQNRHLKLYEVKHPGVTAIGRKKVGDKVLKNIINTYAEPNLSPEEIRARAISGDDPLGEFSQICRRDLAMQT